MRLALLLELCFIPLLAAGQLTTPVKRQQQSAQLSTSFSTGITLGPNRQESTITSAIVVTVTQAAASSSGSVAASASGNSTSNSTATASGNSTSTKSTTASNLPTAATSVDGGGNAPGGAPSPGATSDGTVYGPDDGYIAAALALQRNMMAVAVVGAMVAGALVVL